MQYAGNHLQLAAETSAILESDIMLIDGNGGPPVCYLQRTTQRCAFLHSTKYG